MRREANGYGKGALATHKPRIESASLNAPDRAQAVAESKMRDGHGNIYSLSTQSNRHSKRYRKICIPSQRHMLIAYEDVAFAVISTYEGR